MSIEDDHLSGAAVLTEKALCYVHDLAEKNFLSKEEFIAFVKNECIKIIHSQESMVSLRNELSQVLKAAMKEETLEKAEQKLQQTAKERLEFLKKAETTIIRYGISLIKQETTVLTHSRSSTVEKMLISAYRRTPFHIIVTESRPNYEGRLLAKHLADQSIPVTLVVDAAATLFNPDLVLVGADSVTPEYVINKVGTKFLALAFPTYVACSTSKFTKRRVTIEEKDPEEVLPKSHKHKNICTKNYYFDGTPLEFVRGFITEYGVLPPEKVKSLLNR